MTQHFLQGWSIYMVTMFCLYLVKSSNPRQP